mgnify:CR=1 FL=1
MNIVVLTSNHPRHKYFANQISKHFNLIGVVSEQKSFSPLKNIKNSDEENIIINHFQRRELKEKKEFDTDFDNGFDILKINKNSINKSVVLDFLKSEEIDYVFVYGTGIIGELIIKEFPNKIINMHLGLSPYYRGAGTNFWPIVNAEPQYCGVTIHFLDKGSWVNFRRIQIQF